MRIRGMQGGEDLLVGLDASHFPRLQIEGPAWRALTRQQPAAMPRIRDAAAQRLKPIVEPPARSTGRLQIRPRRGAVCGVDEAVEYLAQSDVARYVVRHVLVDPPPGQRSREIRQAHGLAL